MLRSSLRHALNRLLGPIFAFAADRFADHEHSPRRVKPFQDAGGYGAHGDWPFVPSDLLEMRRFHASHNITGRQQDHA